MQYFYSLDGAAQQGPVDSNGLRAAGVRPDTMVWREGMTDWQPAGRVPELAGLFPVAAPPPPPQATPYGTPPGGPVLNYPPPGYGPPAHPAAGTNGMAIASFVCGLVGVVTACCFVPSILAIVFGYSARGQIARGHGTGRAGRPRASSSAGSRSSWRSSASPSASATARSTSTDSRSGFRATRH